MMARASIWLENRQPVRLPQCFSLIFLALVCNLAFLSLAEGERGQKNRVFCQASRSTAKAAYVRKERRKSVGRR